MLAEAHRSIISTRYNKLLSRAFLSRARSANNAPSQVRFAVGDQVMYWRGNNKRNNQWSMRWLGPGIIIGHESRANVWISHRNAVVKAAGNHVRLTEVEEQLPWHDLYDSHRDTDEQTYFDLCPPGASRDPQHEGPSSAAQLTPLPVPDEPMPDTFDVPVPNSSVYAPVHNSRVRWRSDVLQTPTPQPVRPVEPLENVPQNVSPDTPSDLQFWSASVPNIHEVPPPQSPITPQYVQPETPLPQSSINDTPMPSQQHDDTPPWVYQEPDTPWNSCEPDTPADIPEQVPLQPMRVSTSREETNLSAGDPIRPPPWFVDAETSTIAGTSGYSIDSFV